MKINFKILLNFSIAILACFITILFIVFLYEYYNVAIAKNIDDYPFGNENLSETFYYKNAAIYSSTMLNYSIASFISTCLIWIGIFKERTILIILSLLLIIGYFYNSF